jgi:hypothetical protein
MSLFECKLLRTTKLRSIILYLHWILYSLITLSHPQGRNKQKEKQGGEKAYTQVALQTLPRRVRQAEQMRTIILVLHYL